MNNFWLDKKLKSNGPQDVCTSDDSVAEMMEAYRSALEEDYLAKAELLEDEYNAKITEAYEQLSEDMSDCEKIAEKGYAQAWDLIKRLQKELDYKKRVSRREAAK